VVQGLQGESTRQFIGETWHSGVCQEAATCL
jgi:hypothetical protein